MSISTPPVTAEQLYDMPDDGLRRELVQGEVFTMNPAGFGHGAISVRLARLLDDHVEHHRLGVVVGAETGFVLARNPDTVRAPDAAFVRQSRVEKVAALQKFFPGPPDLAVEVISPDDRPRDIEAKIHDWLSHGAVVVWSVDPRGRTVTVYRSAADPLVLGEQEFLEAPDLLPGLRLNVAEIFPKW
jgi:Uma2 family endonuclease